MGGQRGPQLREHGGLLGRQVAALARIRVEVEEPLAARVRSGALDPNRLRLAAYLGLRATTKGGLRLT